MSDELLYHEKLSSQRTTVLFLALTLLFILLYNWRVSSGHLDTLAVVFLAFFIFFLFYSLNYRTLVIQITQESVRLRFGIFKWTIPFSNIESACIDVVPAFKKYGGAGIHFMTVNKRYRASFNFLEYPRVLIALKNKTGPVQDISFSTRQPEEVLQHIHDAI